MIPFLLMALVFLGPLAALLRKGFSWPDAAVGAVAWGWGNLVVTANVLSIFGQLGSRPFYLALAIGLSVASWGAISALTRLRPVVDSAGLLAAPPGQGPHGGMGRALLIGSSGLLALGLLWHLLVALTTEPTNPDTLMYRLPRVWWYLSNGSLRHFAESVDPRVIFYPFNVSLIYLPLALFGAAPVAFNLPSVAAWAIVVLAVFRLSRWMGANRSLASFVAFLLAFAPIVFIEATSTNDEIVAAAGVLGGLYFFLRYFRGGSRVDLATAALALGCGLGAKLHFFFFWPAVLILGGWLVFATLRRPAIRAFVLHGRRLRDVAVALLVAMALSVPFLIYNRLSSPHFAYSGDEARNSPFSSRVAAQTLSLLTGQLFLSPFPTFETSKKAKVRQARIAAWNAWWNERLYANVDQSKAFTYATYQFLGVTDPMAGNHFENTEWAGLLPWLLIVGGIVLIARRAPGQWLAVALAVAFLAWWLAYGATMKYFDTVGVYFAYPLILCGSFLTAALMPGRRRWVTGAIWALALLVGAGHLALCRGILQFNPHHGLKRVAAALQAGKPFDASAPGIGLGTALAGLNRATILLTHWAVPYYEIMKTSPATPYFIGNPGRPAPGAIITAIEANPVFDGYLPVKVSLPSDRGLVYLDTILCSYGPELIFGDAASFGARRPGARSRYLIFQASVDESSPAARVLRISSWVHGGDGLASAVKYRFTLRMKNGTENSTGWLAAPADGTEFPIAATPSDQLELRIEVADAMGALIGDATFRPFLPASMRQYNTVSP